MMYVGACGWEGEPKVLAELPPSRVSLDLGEVGWGLPARVVAGSESRCRPPRAQHNLGTGTGALWGLVGAHPSAVCSSTVDVPGKHPRAPGLLTKWPQTPHQVSLT